MKLNEALEMYLEEILLLSRHKPDLRQIDIVHRMGYSRPTISNMMKKLEGLGLIITAADGTLTLSPNGRLLAEDIYEKHQVLTCMLTSMGIDRETAQNEACRIEHVISASTLEKIKNYYLKCGVYDPAA